MTEKNQTRWSVAFASAVIWAAILIADTVLVHFGLASGTDWLFILASGAAVGSLAIALTMTVASIFRP